MRTAWLVLIAGVVSAVVLSGCINSLTPQNAEPIARDLQAKFDNIQSYSARVYTINPDGSNSFSQLAVIRPDKYVDFTAWGEHTFVPRVGICNGQKRQEYSSASGAIVEQQADCARVVSDCFNVFDKIKKIATYQNIITQRPASCDDVKEIVFGAPEYRDDSGNFRLIEKSATGYQFGESVASAGTGCMHENQDAIELTFIDETGANNTMFFLKDDYVLLKYEKKTASGEKTTTYFSDLRLNEQLPAGQEFSMPSLEQIEAYRSGLQKK